jgi:cystine transport system substrate-binding protein
VITGWTSRRACLTVSLLPTGTPAGAMPLAEQLNELPSLTETKMKRLKSLFKPGLAATLLCCVVATSAHATDLLDTVKQAGVLRIAMEGTYPPFDYRNNNGQLEGFDVEVAKAVAARLGVKPEFITTEWSGILAGLQAGKFDVIVNQVGITPARKQVLSFSEPYIYSAAMLLQRQNDTRQFKSLEDLKGRKVGVTMGSNYVDLVKTNPAVDLQVYPGTPENLSDLAAGRIDAALNDRLMIKYLITNSHLPLRPGEIISGGETEMGIPFRKGNPKFAKAIDDAINAMRQDGTLKKLSMQWFGTDTTAPVAQ